MIFGWGMKLFSSFLWGYENIKNNHLDGTKICTYVFVCLPYILKHSHLHYFNCRSFRLTSEASSATSLGFNTRDQIKALAGSAKRRSGMKIAWNNLVSFHRSMFLAQRLLDGVRNYFAERWWGTKTVSVFKMGV